VARLASERYSNATNSPLDGKLRLAIIQRLCQLRQKIITPFMISGKLSYFKGIVCVAAQVYLRATKKVNSNISHATNWPLSPLKYTNLYFYLNLGYDT
jgi:hypothetical protein